MKTTDKIANMLKLNYGWQMIRLHCERELLDEVMGRPEYEDPTLDSSNISGDKIREAGELLLTLAESIVEGYDGDYIDMRELLEVITENWIHF